jgi:hypothetical protein
MASLEEVVIEALYGDKYPASVDDAVERAINILEDNAWNVEHMQDPEVMATWRKLLTLIIQRQWARRSPGRF